MTELIELAGMIGEHSANPVVKVLASLVAGLSAFAGHQRVVEKAKVTSAKAEQREIDQAEKDEKVSFETGISDAYNQLKNTLWDGLTEYKRDCIAKGIHTVQYDVGGDTLDNKAVSEIKRDYNGAVKDVSAKVKGKWAELIRECIRLGGNTVHRRGESIDRMSVKGRCFFFAEVHKVGGENQALTTMESERADFEYFKNIFSELLTHAEDISNIRENEIERIQGEYSVGTFDFKKIYKTFFRGRKL